MPAVDARKLLARMLKFTRVARHNMHLAHYPDGDALCLFSEVKGRLVLFPFVIMTVPLALVVQAIETEGELRISQIHERPTVDPEAAIGLFLGCLGIVWL